MKPIWIFRHIECEGPGYLQQILDRYQLDYQVIAIDRQDPVPVDINGSSGLVFMGGPMSANDAEPWIAAEIALIQQAAENGLPLLGHCLGGQLISKAMGAEIKANAVKEIGWHEVEPFDNSQSTQWLGALDKPVEVFHWHGETFDLPDNATPILKSRFCENQAYVKDNILALQCHVEMLPKMVIEWAELYEDELLNPSDSVQSKAQMSEHLEQRIGKAQQLADSLYDRWLTQGGFI